MFFKSPWISMGDTSIRFPARRGMTGLESKCLLLSSEKDPELVPVPLLVLDYCSSPSALSGPVPTIIMVQATVLMIQNTHSAQGDGGS